MEDLGLGGEALPAAGGGLGCLFHGRAQCDDQRSGFVSWAGRSHDGDPGVLAAGMRVVAVELPVHAPQPAECFVRGHRW